MMQSLSCSLQEFHLDVIVINSDAGWSSPVARRAHNPKVVGSNPAPATKIFKEARQGLFLCDCSRYYPD
jgi:hypothetical protein